MGEITENGRYVTGPAGTFYRMELDLDALYDDFDCRTCGASAGEPCNLGPNAKGAQHVARRSKGDRRNISAAAAGTDWAFMSAAGRRMSEDQVKGRSGTAYADYLKFGVPEGQQRPARRETPADRRLSTLMAHYDS